mmetsp:Transcript_63056/g.124640  ORF Transcript_63056/g.124640 Transcript_63056/m.124640 type:complete len:142 (-) Transcript_63056:716-1141(-)
MDEAIARAEKEAEAAAKAIEASKTHGTPNKPTESAQAPVFTDVFTVKPHIPPYTVVMPPIMPSAPSLFGAWKRNMAATSIAALLWAGCAISYVLCALAAQGASKEFWRYLQSHELRAHVVNASGFPGPVNALLTPEFVDEA